MEKKEGAQKAYYLYLLECYNGSYYAGYTTNIERRFQAHCKGSASCKYTRSFPPKKIAACWAVNNDLSCVLKLERALKQLSATQKNKLAHTPESLLNIIKNITVAVPLDIYTIIHNDDQQSQ